MKKILALVLAAAMLLSMTACGEPETTGPKTSSTTQPTEPKPTDVPTTAPKPTYPPTTAPKPTEPAPTEPNPTEHTHNYTEIVTAPTCTEKGYTTYTCACGDSYKADEVAALDHTWSEWITTKEATEEAEGAAERTCAICSEKENKTLPKLDHVHKYSETVTAPTCTEKGYTTYTCACGDSYKDDYVNAKGHKYSDKVTKEPTCTQDGVRIYTCACGDSYKEAIAKLAHSYTAIVTVPTCTEKGYTTHTCTCGDTYTDKEVAALGHSWGQWVTTKEPTEEAEGAAERACSVCSEKESKTLAKLDHVHKYSETVTAPTCTEKGYTTYACACGDSYTDKEVAATGHSYTATVTKEPTCTSEGERSYTCACGDAYTEVIEKTAHSYIHTVTEPTCTEKGYTTYACACGDWFIYGYTDALGHDYEEFVTEPTEMEQGYTTHTCSACGHSYVDSYTGPLATVVASGSCGESVNWELNSAGILSISGTGDMTWQYSAPWYSYRNQIQQVVIEEGVTSIGRMAFDNCDSLTDISIPNTITNLGYMAFYGCDNIRYNEYNNAYYLGNSSNPFVALVKAKSTSILNCRIHPDTKIISNPAFKGCEQLTSIIIPDGVIYIDSDTFSACTKLSSIYIPESVTIAGSGVFYKCTALTTITIPSSWTRIPKDMFAASGLTSIIIPDNITSIGWGAFMDCTSLNSLAIGSGVTSIEENAFSRCSGLTNISVEPENTVFHSAGNCLIETAEKKLIVGCKTSVIPDDGSVTQIAEDAFAWCSGLTSIVIPDSITDVGRGVFRYCSNLTSVTLSKNLYHIGWDMFNGCTSLTNITIPEGIYYIDRSAFEKCTSLSSIVIPNGIRMIGEEAFAYCTGLSEIVIPDSVNDIGRGAFCGCTSLTKITLPFVGSEKNGTGDTRFGYIFSDGWNISNSSVPSSLKTVTITSATIISSYAFDGCSGLDNIVFEGKWHWWRTTDTDAWNNKTGGTKTDTDTPGTNADYFTSTYVDHYWYRAPHDYNDQGVCVVCGKVTSLGLEYTVCDDGSYYSVTGIGTCTDTDIVIPEIYNGLFVLEIEREAFFNCTNLTSVAIPDSVTRIGGWAFYGCSGLTSITIPDSVTDIGYSAFSGCSGLTSITIPTGVTSIGNGAFYKCSSLTSINIPDSVASIGNGAFSGCSGLTGITVSENNTAYASQDGILYNKEKTEFIHIPAKLAGNITIPKGISCIEDGLFCNMTGLTNVMFESGSQLTSIGDYAFDGCTSLASINVPNGVTSIGYRAFYKCTGLTNITIPDSITSIGDYAFSYCSSLTYNEYDNAYYLGNATNPYVVLVDAKDTSILNCTIYKDTKIIYDGAFYDCRKLTSIIIPDSVTDIGNYAFDGCSNLTSITIPAGVTSIGYEAFSGCGSLESIVVETANNNYHSEGNCLVNTATKTLIAGCKNSIIPDDGSVTSIGSYAFDSSGLTGITIPNSVTSIGDYAFRHCGSLASITISSNVTSIGGATFWGCSSLASITIPNSVTSIGGSAFWGCSSLTSIHIPNSVSRIDGSAFLGCSSLTSITVGENNTAYASQDGILYNKDKTQIVHVPKAITGNITIPNSITNIGGKVFENCTSLTSITIPDSVTSIGRSAFSNCSSLTSVILSNKLTNITTRVFENCSSLTSVVIPASVTFVSKEAFIGCTSLVSIVVDEENTKYASQDGILYNKDKTEVVHVPNNLSGSITIPDSVTSIGDNMFCNCKNLISVTIGNGVTSISTSAFSGCTSLASITVGANNTTYASQDGILYNKDKTAFVLIPDKLSGNVTIPSAITSIDKYAFDGYSGLTGIAFEAGSQLNSIGDYAFRDCDNLTSITIPEGVASIGKYAFVNCDKLASVTIPLSVTSIGDYALAGCENLTSIYFVGTIEQWNAIVNAYDGVHTVYCSDGEIIVDVGYI